MSNTIYSQVIQSKLHFCIKVWHVYLKIPDHHGSIQTHTAVLLHFGFLSRHNTQLSAATAQETRNSILTRYKYIWLAQMYKAKSPWHFVWLLSQVLSTPQATWKQSGCTYLQQGHTFLKRYDAILLLNQMDRETWTEPYRPHGGVTGSTFTLNVYTFSSVRGFFTMTVVQGGIWSGLQQRSLTGTEPGALCFMVSL